MSEKVFASASALEWVKTRIPGVSFKPLNPAQVKGAGTYIIRMEPGSKYPAHLHPGGEEVYVLEGSMKVGGDRMGPGDYLFTPPGGSHAAESPEGCTFLVVLPEPIAIID